MGVPQLLLLLVSFTKGPYLQNVSRDAITVQWQTDVATTGTITATPMGGGTPTTVSAPSATFHKVRLTGLSPSTFYQYSVSAGGASAGGHFPTAVGSPDEAFEFIVYGDNKFGDGLGWCSGSYTMVRDRLIQEQVDFILHTGDMVDMGDEPHYSTFFTCYQELMKSHVIFPVIGNH